jgi:hypothetical protein
MRETPLLRRSKLKNHAAPAHYRHQHYSMQLNREAAPTQN